MKNFCIGAKFENQFLEKLALINKEYENTESKIVEIFGSLTNPTMGSGRHPWYIPSFSANKLREYINRVHSQELKFNYLLNTSCLGNIEYTKEGKKNIINFLDCLVECGIDRVTIAIPFLFEIVKKGCPNLKITVSVISDVDSVEKAKFYQDLGADRITLSYSINRDFNLLKKIREKVSCDLELILNDICVLNCPVRNYHYNFVCHITSKYNPDSGEPFMERCVLRKLQDLSLIIKSPFIRPEDVDEYSGIGINYFKIIGRETEINCLLSLAKIYLNSDFKGNLTHLVTFDAFHIDKEFLYIENKDLDGFIEYFKNKKNDCRDGCDSCRYCEEIAKKVIKIKSEEMKNGYIQDLKNKTKI